MILMPLQFTASFMFLCALLLLGTIYSRIHWIIKATLVVSSLLFCFVSYHGYENTLGYPVAAELPSIFQLLYPAVHEPVPSKHDDGAIYLWIADPNGRDEPRAIIIPYSKQNRDVTSQAKKKIQKGEQVFMSFKKKGQDSDGDDGTQGNKSNGKNGKVGNKGGTSGTNNLPYYTNGQVLDFEQPADTVPKKAVDTD